MHKSANRCSLCAGLVEGANGGLVELAQCDVANGER